MRLPSTDKGLMSGTAAKTFAERTTTRAMLMTVLARYAGEDTTGGTWYEKSMEWAGAKGVSDGTNPNADITREQLVTMLLRRLSGCKRFAERFLRRCKRSSYAEMQCSGQLPTALSPATASSTAG